ncbi:sensor histidine kinase [Effusibacillus lacus]|uniref:histidine kinase n=1 Tax=Effusibacillus lacus TaxID=1348429 RepID=A0A292YLZ2_9BACL|nr:HAMP domain-containing sensor histidine kinase [Effusibacillus lacus]TCS70800.1 signal transduction histidine kinase [Effusibacillus lacus]GAX89404.1 two-component sensor histidine kinase [Effusibacillus lacus]
MAKRSIGKKLISSYLLLIVITLTVSGALFYASMKKYMIAEAKRGLAAEAKHLIQLAEENNGSLPLKRLVMTKLALRMIESDYIVVQKGDQEVIHSSTGEINKGNRTPFPVQAVFLEGKPTDGQVEFKGKDILYVALPVHANKSKQVTHAMILFTDLNQVRNVTKAVAWVIVRGFLITGAIMLLVAFVMMRSLTRPVKVLQHAVGRLARRDFTPPEVIKTGDELEDLSHAFQQMTIELKRYDEGQRRFLQNASHELKTPLMAIQGYAEGIRDGIFSGADAERVLDVISAESIRLKKLVDELIYLSKLETMEDIYEPSLVDLKMIVEESILRVESLARQKGIEIVVQADADVPKLLLDPDKMIQALLNLLANGIRHAQSKVTIRIVSDSEAIRLILQDDGPGFQSGDKDRIFDRFFRGDKGDTGLGLAITKAIIEKSGAAIRADNGQNGGAVFIIGFPAEKGPFH